MKKTTKAQFNSFIKHCERFRNRFGLLGWNVYYRREDLDDAYATISIDLAEKTATICFNTQISREDAEKNWIRRAAQHEMLHLLVGRLAHVAYSRYVTDDEIRETVESLVHSLEAII